MFCLVSLFPKYKNTCKTKTFQGFVTEEEAFQFFVGEIDEELDTEEAEKIVCK